MSDEGHNQIHHIYKAMGHIDPGHPDELGCLVDPAWHTITLAGQCLHHLILPVGFPLQSMIDQSISPLPFQSTAFTGKYGYGVAALWLLAGVIYAGFLLISLCCANKKWRKLERSTCSKQCYLRPIILGVFFAFLAM